MAEGREERAWRERRVGERERVRECGEGESGAEGREEEEPCVRSRERRGLLRSMGKGRQSGLRRETREKREIYEKAISAER